MNLNQVTIPSLDLSKSIPFYELLGLTLIVHTTKDYARFVCPIGESTFSIQRVSELSKDDSIHVYFECENLDEKVKSLQHKGIEFTEMPTDQPWLWREARLKDPDGNLIILYFAGENRINPPWRLKE